MQFVSHDTVHPVASGVPAPAVVLPFGHTVHGSPPGGEFWRGKKFKHEFIRDVEVFYDPFWGQEGFGNDPDLYGFVLSQYEPISNHILDPF